MKVEISHEMIFDKKLYVMLYNIAVQQLADADLLTIFPANNQMTLHRRAAAIRCQTSIDNPHATSTSDVDHQVISPLHLRSDTQRIPYHRYSFRGLQSTYVYINSLWGEGSYCRDTWVVSTSIEVTLVLYQLRS